MTLTMDQQLDLAAKVAATAHANQFRKDGTPYFWHPVCVAIRCDSRIEKIVALLHDTVEDSDLTLQDLRDYGFFETVVLAVDSLTRRHGETYTDFIHRCSKNYVAVNVKLADIDHNLSDVSALDPEDAAFLNKRYTKARAVLLGTD